MRLSWMTGTRTHSATRAAKETWVYDVKKNVWTPVGNTLDLLRYDWLTAVGGEKHGVVFLVAFGDERRTYAFRYDPTVAPAEHTGQGSYTHECSLDYDPVHDVAVALIPEGFSRRLGTLLFRYDPNTAKYKR